MRRSDREITDFNEIIDVLSRCDTVRLGMNGEDFPYVVPLSFGYETVEKNVCIYIHGAIRGLKHDLIAKNNRVCVEADIFHRFVARPEHRAVTAEYESFIGFGRVREEALKGLDLICTHAGFKGFDYDREGALPHTRVYKIELESCTGKRRFINQK